MRIDGNNCLVSYRTSLSCCIDNVGGSESTSLSSSLPIQVLSVQGPLGIMPKLLGHASHDRHRMCVTFSLIIINWLAIFAGCIIFFYCEIHIHIGPTHTNTKHSNIKKDNTSPNDIPMQLTISFTSPLINNQFNLLLLADNYYLMLITKFQNLWDFNYLFAESLTVADLTRLAYLSTSSFWSLNKQMELPGQRWIGTHPLIWKLFETDTDDLCYRPVTERINWMSKFNAEYIHL